MTRGMTINLSLITNIPYCLTLILPYSLSIYFHDIPILHKYEDENRETESNDTDDKPEYVDAETMPAYSVATQALIDGLLSL